MKLNLQYFADPTNEEPKSEDKQAGTDEQTVDGGGSDEEKQKEPEEEKKFTQSQLDEILKKRLSQQEAKAAKDKAESEKLAAMNEKQANEYKLKQAEDRAKAAEDGLSHFKMIGQARNMLQESNINVSDDLLDLVVSNEADSTKANIELLKGFAKGIEDNVKTSFLKGSTPRNTTGSEIKNVTNADFDKMNLRQRSELAKKNPELFNKITGGTN